MAKRAVDLDLVDPVAHVELAHSLQYDGQLDASLEQYRLAQQLDPDFIGIHLMLAEHYILVQKFDRAIPHLEQLDKVIDQLPPSILGFVGLHWGRVGQAGKTSAILAQLKQKAETEFVAASSFAFLYIGLGEKGEALNQLELGYEERNPTMLWLREDVKLEPLRDELRYQALVRRMNFPD
jgi:tetratricopeptide (TPR) repeat protein